MCWVSMNYTKKVASEDKVVYKELTPVSFRKASSPVYREFTYTVGVLNKRVPICVLDAKGPSLIKYNYRVDEGYHSYMSPNDTKLSTLTSLYKMIIPKGTIYYESDLYPEIVSENLIMVERITYFEGKPLPFFIKVGNLFAKLLSSFTSYGH